MLERKTKPLDLRNPLGMHLVEVLLTIDEL
jgi:hypothetical protein